MEMISAFTDVLHVPNLTTDAQMMNVLKQSDAFSKDDLAKLASKLKGRKASIGGRFFPLKEQLTAQPRFAKASFRINWVGGYFYVSVADYSTVSVRGEDFERLFKLASLKSRV
jgi:hypothetical protein